MPQRGVYPVLLKTVARAVPAEPAHHGGLWLLRLLQVLGPLRLLVARLCRPPATCRTRVLGLDLSTPLGVAAGLDKNARAVTGLMALGFGYVEIGTVTAIAQPGNPKPRMFRLLADRAVVNRMGFNNDGAEVVAGRLARLRSTRPGAAAVIGVSIGRSKVALPEDTVADYVTSARLLAPHADFVTVNVSSPNTAGLRDLHAPDKLGPLLAAVREACADVPVLLKISPDLEDDDLVALCEVVRDAGIAGVVATNTTVSRPVGGMDVVALGAGGFSGAPLAPLATHVQAVVAAQLNGQVLVASGGIDSPEDAVERLAGGAQLVQAYTGFVFGGPAWPRAVNRALARR